MSFICTPCTMQTEVELYRQKLENMIVKKNLNLNDKNVVKLSQMLDDLIAKCIHCKETVNSTPKLDLLNIHGTHSSFYYYSKWHLFTSLYQYIKDGLDKNELICLSMQDNLNDYLMRYLRANGLDISSIERRDVKEFILSNKQGGLPLLKEKVSFILSDENIKQYNGIRWIGQPTFAILCTSQEDFLNWELNINKALEGTCISLLCIYDAYDYMHKEEVINQTIINHSLSTHTHLLSSTFMQDIALAK